MAKSVFSADEASSATAISTRDGAAVYSPVVLGIYDWWVLGVSNRFAWRCSTRDVLLPFYRQHVGREHLEVGVGTGYYPANTAFPSGSLVTLLDLNRSALKVAAARLGHLRNEMVQEDVLDFRGRLGARKFDSIAMFYLLHCLSGSMEEKMAVFANLRQHLKPDGVLFGATILGDDAGHNWFGRQLMATYNGKGIFGNRSDSIDELVELMGKCFADVEIWQQGAVALFTAKFPL